MKGLVVSFAFASMVVAVSAQTYDPTASFSTTSNPNGVWSVGRSTSATTGFTLNTTAGAAFGVWTGWMGPNSTADGMVGKNLGATAFGVPSGSLVFSPGDPVNPVTSRYAYLRWTAPTAGTVTLNNINFGVGDSGAVDVFVNVNGVTQFSAIGTSVAATPSFGSFALVAGSTVDFVVGPGTSSSNDSTPFSGTVTLTPVPEPASMTALALGAIALIRRRKRS